jgi:hypothetical protein
MTEPYMAAAAAILGLGTGVGYIVGEARAWRGFNKIIDEAVKGALDKAAVGIILNERNQCRKLYNKYRHGFVLLESQIIKNGKWHSSTTIDGRAWPISNGHIVHYVMDFPVDESDILSQAEVDVIFTADKKYFFNSTSSRVKISYTVKAADGSTSTHDYKLGTIIE